MLRLDAAFKLTLPYYLLLLVLLIRFVLPLSVVLFLTFRSSSSDSSCFRSNQIRLSRMGTWSVGCVALRTWAGVWFCDG
ncbi:uncharacterized protein BKA78DRAFT_68212 [Phyllosticta capitalensis]|uniref:uncharacterized protein n=1 Tax=Phyllosticta capitalensis TaxID=121624 RepID=UPI003130A4DD